MERRDVLKTAAAAAMASAAGSGPAGAQTAPLTIRTPPETFDVGGMKFRTLGETGQRVSLVGIGGFHLAKPKTGPTSDGAVRIVRTALDAGINFCDNCWDYNGGESEVRMGLALRDGYRQKAFLMTKIDGRTGAAAMGQIETSLKRLQTDHLDLLQFHEIIRMDDPDRVFAAGGALEAALKAREQGKLKYIGFTGHKSPEIHARMFEVAQQHGFRFDTVQMPVNIMDAHYDSFQARILPLAAERKTAVLAMKTFGDTFIIDTKVCDPIDMLHYSMSQPVAVVITGCDNLEVLDQALKAVRSYQPMSAERQQAMLALSAKLGRDGGTERYKVSQVFDGTAKNPEWLTQA